LRQRLTTLLETVRLLRSFWRRQSSAKASKRQVWELTHLLYVVALKQHP